MKQLFISALAIGFLFTNSFSQTIFNFSNTTGLWGFVTNTGQEIVPESFKSVSYFSTDGYGTAIDPVSRLAILFNSKGEKIDLKIAGATDFEYIGENAKGNDLKCVIFQSNKKYGIVNLNGKIIHEATYDKIDASSSAFCIGKKGKAFSILHTDGKVVALSNDILEVRKFSEGLAPYRSMNKKFGFINESGEVVIPATHESVGYFSAGLAWAKNVERKVGFIDKTGKIVIAQKYNMVKDFDVIAKRTLASTESGQLYLTTTGEEITVAEATKLGDFNNGFAYAFKGELVGFVDPSGKWIVDASYDKVHGFENGYARVRKNGLWGFVNTKGEVAITPDFQDIENFRNGFAPVMIGTKWGLIDTSGKMAFEPKYLKLK